VAKMAQHDAAEYERSRNVTEKTVFPKPRRNRPDDVRHRNGAIGVFAMNLSSVTPTLVALSSAAMNSWLRSKADEFEGRGPKLTRVFRSASARSPSKEPERVTPAVFGMD